MLEWIAPQEYTTNSTDDEAWQAQNQITQNDTVRFRNRSVLGTQSNLHISIRARRKRFLKHPPKSQMERVFGRTNKHVHINRYRTSVFVNMVGTGLDTGCMKFQLLEHKLNQTVLIPESQLFSHFSIKKFFISKNFSYICDTNKRIRQLQITLTAMV